MVDQDFERRQVLKAYRRGLISDQLFAEQMAEIAGAGRNGEDPRADRGAPWPRRLRGRLFANEREMVLHFLDELRAAETFGAIALGLWAEVTRDPGLRGGLRAISEREAMHGRVLGERLRALGGIPVATLPAEMRDAARARLGSPIVADAEKLRELIHHLPSIARATAPIREVLEQIEEDRETRALLESIVEDETATARWLLASAERLGVASPAREEDES